MRDLSSFFQICIYITIVIIILNCLISFVAVSGFFDTTVHSGIDIDGDPVGKFEQLTELSDGGDKLGADALWSIVSGGLIGLGAGIVLGWAFHSTQILGVSIFSGIFWASYISAYASMSSLNLLAGLEGFVAIGSLGMLFIFGGAVAGMLSGSG